MMQKPDSDGYINVTWPSQNIPHGGLFHTKVVEPSVARQQFLKVLLDESKLSIIQRSKNGYCLRQKERKEEKIRPEEPTIRPRTSRRRSLSEIRESGIFELERYRPIKKGEDREKLKDSLANRMAYGDKEEQSVPQPRIPKEEIAFQLPSKKQQWNELLTQIRERAEWLGEMEDLGHAAPHRYIVKDQIAERLRALDALGVDSRSSSARSSASEFSVLPSERSVRSGRSSRQGGTVVATSKTTPIKLKPPKKAGKQEENVLAYERFSPVQYSPRRRV